MGDNVIPFITFLITKGDGDSSGFVKAGVTVGKFHGAFKETDVLKGDRLGATRGGALGVLTAAHSEEECTDAKVSNVFIKLRYGG